MPLIDLRTNLKSLKYGHDRPGGGDSAQPYIQTDINNPTSALSIAIRNPLVKEFLKGINDASTFLRLGTFDVDSAINSAGSFIDKSIKIDDGLVRGGILGATEASIVDTIRIAKFFTDVPKGTLFAVKQVGLQLSNPRLEVRKGIRAVTSDLLSFNPARVGNALGTLTGGLLEPTRIYNLGINTLSQVSVNAFGGHIVRHGILPIQSDETKYKSIVEFNNKDNNRLVKLTGELGIKGKVIRAYANNVATNLGSGQVRSTFSNTSNPNLSNLQGVSVNSSVKGPNIEVGEKISSLSYLGGPNSTYGIGNTDIKRSIITNFNPNRQLFEDITIKAVDSLTRLEDQNTFNDQYLTSAATGISKIDSRLYPYIDKNDPNYDSSNAASIRDNTVIKYTDVQPRLRKYYELTDTLDKISSRSDLYNIIDTDKLHSSNVTNNTLSSTGVTTLRNVSSTEGNTTILKNDITYFNGIIDNTGTYQKVILKGFKSWNDIAREKRTGDFGEGNAIIVNFSSGSKSINSKPVLRADSINLTPIFGADKYWGQDTYASQKYGNFNIRDLVKFRIQNVRNNNPEIGDFMIFRALLTNLTDNVDADWSDVKYVGRGNPFYIYSGFSRKVQIGFKVAALSAEEMMPMYSKLNYLMSTLMPNYNNNAMQGNLHRMTIGNYFDGQLGIINSLSYTVSNDSPWEIALDEPEGGVRQLILPHIIEVSLGFIPIGADTKTENKIEAKSLDTSFIAQNNTGTDIDKIQYYNDFFNPL